MNVGFTLFAIISFITAVSAKVTLDEDMLLYWRRSDTATCEPFTTYFINCNKCVCSADGTSYCTRMACYKAPKFLTGAPVEIIPVNDFNTSGQSDDDDSPIDSVRE